MFSSPFPADDPGEVEGSLLEQLFRARDGFLHLHRTVREGEYRVPGESGRGLIALYPDALCVLPQTVRAVRIPLCFTGQIRLDGYQLTLTSRSGRVCTVGKMGYDTMPFAERAMRAAETVKKQRAKALSNRSWLSSAFSGGVCAWCGAQNGNAAFGPGVCALELFTGEDAATYLYRFSEPRELFLQMLEEATEAMGTHREIIYLPQEQLAEKPLYRMAVDRSEAVRFLRERSDGRLIHGARHAERLAEFLRS